jgi:anthranilate synthase component 1
MSVEKIEKIENRIFGKTSAYKQDFRSKGFDYSEVPPEEKLNIESNFARDRFIESVERAKEYIINGDAFQIVLSQRFSIKYNSSPFNIYRVLRTVNPSPYMYYLNYRKFKIVGASPEPLLKISGRRVSTYPIAGTRRRGKNKSEDRYLANDLLKDEKEKAEHNMLVDLARNDLGRFCRFGSVRVSKYMYVEKYSHVMHLVSRVEGVIDRNKTIYDALKSVFPAGTLTGAPKIRAMQIISELEPDRRGPYGGVVGYFGYNGNLDTCITIRTAVLKDNIVHIQSGAGIVYDSVPEKEREETINKAGALLKSISLIE